MGCAYEQRRKWPMHTAEAIVKNMLPNVLTFKAESQWCTTTVEKWYSPEPPRRTAAQRTPRHMQRTTCNMQQAACSMQRTTRSMRPYRVQHATCNMQHAACGMRPYRVQHATCNMQHAACNMQHAACSMQHAACSMRHATVPRAACNMQHAACSMQHATCSMQHATCSMQHATCSMQHAACDRTAEHSCERHCAAAHPLSRPWQYSTNARARQVVPAVARPRRGRDERDVRVDPRLRQARGGHQGAAFPEKAPTPHAPP